MGEKFQGKTILLGVTGSIAAFRAADLASMLVQEGAAVHCVMTESAAEFITPKTLHTLSRNPVLLGSQEAGQSWKPEHIHLADTIDCMLVAPLTAHKLACFAHGLAPDLLSNIYLATRAPVVLAPAMNGNMLNHPATQANLDILKSRGHAIVPPQTGILACGYEGEGKLASLGDIVHTVAAYL